MADAKMSSKLISNSVNIAIIGVCIAAIVVCIAAIRLLLEATRFLRRLATQPRFSRALLSKESTGCVEELPNRSESLESDCSSQHEKSDAVSVCNHGDGRPTIDHPTITVEDPPFLDLLLEDGSNYDSYRIRELLEVDGGQDDCINEHFVLHQGHHRTSRDHEQVSSSWKIPTKAYHSR